jgi:hypothetical protein
MTRHRFAPITFGLSLLAVAACNVDPGDPFDSLTSVASISTTNNNMEDEESGDTGTPGDGDGDTGPGDGDGDGDTGPGDGDGDTGPGDGDGDAGDGDGDGDGDTGPGDGDGDTGLPDNCGWNAGGNPAGYYCGFMGEDPSGTTPIGCPPGLEDGAPCGEVTGAGCCDSNGDNWFCAEDGMGGTLLVLEAC